MNYDGDEINEDTLFDNIMTLIGQVPEVEALIDALESEHADHEASYEGWRQRRMDAVQKHSAAVTNLSRFNDDVARTGYKEGDVVERQRAKLEHEVQRRAKVLKNIEEQKPESRSPFSRVAHAIVRERPVGQFRLWRGAKAARKITPAQLNKVRGTRDLKMCGKRKVESAAVPIKAALAKGNTLIDEKARRGAPDFSGLHHFKAGNFGAPRRQGGIKFPIVPESSMDHKLESVMEFVTWACSDLIKQKMEAELRSTHPGGAVELDARDTSKIDADLWHLEYEEAALIHGLRAKGHDVHFRSDMSPWAILQIERVS